MSEPAGIGPLLQERSGHFRYESGHHGDLWLELDLLHLRPARVRPLAGRLARRLAAHGAEIVCGPLTGGAFVALHVATELDAGFVHAEGVAAPGAPSLFPVAYRLADAVRPALRGRRVAIVDDVVNAGSATRGALAALRGAGADVVALGALLVLGGRARDLAAAEGLPLEALEERATALWTPEACPLCAAGTPLGGGVS